MTPDKIVRNFQRCTDWEDKYLYLIELGERFCTLKPEDQIDSNRVRGCQSSVWIKLDQQNNVIQLEANSDAAIVRGLLALIIIAYNEKDAETVKKFDINAWFEALELTKHLTPSRAIGLEAIVKQVKKMCI